MNDYNRYKKFKGPKHTHRTIDEMILEDKQVIELYSRFKPEYTSADLGYVPPFPITPGEERLQERNQIPEQRRILVKEEIRIPPYPPTDSEDWAWT